MAIGRVNVTAAYKMKFMLSPQRPESSVPYLVFSASSGATLVVAVGSE